MQIEDVNIPIDAKVALTMRSRKPVSSASWWAA
jgi:hypothetical protein